MDTRILSHDEAIKVAVATTTYEMLLRGARKGLEGNKMGVSCGYLPDLKIWLGVHLTKNSDPAWTGIVGDRALDMGKTALELLHHVTDGAIGDTLYNIETTTKPVGGN